MQGTVESKRKEMDPENRIHIIFKVPEPRVSSFRVYVVKDPESGFWTAFSNEIPGLVTEAETYDRLLERVKAAAEELIVANHVRHYEKVELVPMELTAQEAENVGLL